MKKAIIIVASLFLAPNFSVACGEMSGASSNPMIDDPLKAKIIKKVRASNVKRVSYYKEVPLYISYDFKHLISENLFDGKERSPASLKAAFKERIKWSLLPFNLAIESGDLASKNVIAVFTDPDCPVCKTFNKELAKVEDLHIYTFLNPLMGLHPRSRDKSKVILCSEDKYKAYEEFINGRHLAGNEDLDSCEEKMKELDSLSEKYNLHSTPTIVNMDGISYKGFIQAKNIINFSKLKVN